jgi:hypothetical protein
MAGSQALKGKQPERWQAIPGDVSQVASLGSSFDPVGQMARSQCA